MQLAIECASDEPGVAIAADGVCTHVRTWPTRQNHSRELLPAIEQLLTDAGAGKSAAEAVFVDVGPGGYAALRVGVSIAKGLAHGLGVPLAGVGRLELDAYTVAAVAGGRRIVAVHRAGRGELAWAAYSDAGGAWAELSAPRLLPAGDLMRVLSTGDVLTGDIDEALEQAAAAAGATIERAREHRVVSLAALGHRRLKDGRGDDPTTLVPLYLRAPAIGPQPPR